jgi:hypothetical protein
MELCSPWRTGDTPDIDRSDDQKLNFDWQNHNQLVDHRPPSPVLGSDCMNLIGIINRNNDL